MSEPEALELEEVSICLRCHVAELTVDDTPSAGVQYGKFAEVQLDPSELRKLAAKCTEIADWLERGECDHSEARPALGQWECECGATWPEEPDE